jgi:hypothetical protein
VDEDTFVLPAAWYRSRIPRRGSVGLTPLTPSPDAVAGAAGLLADHTGPVRAEPGLAAALVAYGAGRPDPVGAGAAAVLAGQRLRTRGDLTVFADAWLVEYGPVFAARAAVAALSVGIDHAGDLDPPVRWVVPGMLVPGPEQEPLRQAAGRVRAFLAGASDEVYAEVTAALEEPRGDGLAQRVATSFLVPTRADWVSADCADVAAANAREFATTLLYALSTPDQYMAVWRHLDVWYEAFTTRGITTIVDAMGPAAAGIVAHWIDHPDIRAGLRRRLASMLAALPGDWQFQLLLDRAGNKLVYPALLDAARRFPHRAARLLAQDGRYPEALRTPDPPPEPVGELPPVLADPPWLRPRGPDVVIGGLACDEPATIEWRPGAGAVGHEPEQKLTSVVIRCAGDGVDPVLASEVIRDLEAVSG